MKGAKYKLYKLQPRLNTLAFIHHEPFCLILKDRFPTKRLEKII